MKNFEKALERHRARFDRWLRAAYSSQVDKSFRGEIDAAYPEWSEIEELIGLIFDTNQVSVISSSQLSIIVFMIARNEERAKIIAWLAATETLSFCGNLTKDQLDRLSSACLEEAENNADYQLIAAYRKLPDIDNVQDRFQRRQQC